MNEANGMRWFLNDQFFKVSDRREIIEIIGRLLDDNGAAASCKTFVLGRLSEALEECQLPEGLMRESSVMLSIEAITQLHREHSKALLFWIMTAVTAWVELWNPKAQPEEQPIDAGR